VQGQQLDWTGQDIGLLQEHCETLLVFNQRMPGTKLSVYSSLEKKEDSFTYLLKECKIYSGGEQELPQGGGTKKKESCKRDNYM